ncbi:endothelin-converting enzyme 1 [Plakobranchus ocellatus]|uniref:Endothelin-converting enzyme 1 n=1 Tax=Plakobranchus ocellatus TaxID=259542 RepID=A0AAV3ZAW7_9GAST|nr:endothelin-converting enzyme 1 [Plakobranchus ocellatus]
MSGQGYKRTNFEEDDYTSNGGTPPPVDFTSSVDFRGASTVNGLNVSLPSWRHRTTQEKVLLVLVAALTLVVVILAGVMAVTKAEVKELKVQNQKFCLTPDCVNIASTMLTSMDRTVDPCEDFYTYACGGWMKNNPIPPGHSRWGTFELMWQKNTLVMKNALDKPDSSFKSKAELKAKHYYQSCMDEDKLIEKAGAEPLLDILRGLNWGVNISAWGTAGWKLPGGWNLNKRIENLHLLSIGVFFSVWVAEDAKDSSANILQAPFDLVCQVSLQSFPPYIGSTGRPEISRFICMAARMHRVLSSPVWQELRSLQKLDGRVDTRKTGKRFREVYSFAECLHLKWLAEKVPVSLRLRRDTSEVASRESASIVEVTARYI